MVKNRQPETIAQLYTTVQFSGKGPHYVSENFRKNILVQVAFVLLLTNVINTKSVINTKLDINEME